MLSTKSWQKISKSLIGASILLSIIGLIDSAYLTITHYTEKLVPCNFTHGCESVLKSDYSEIFGIPVAFLGVVFYIVILAMAIHFLIHKAFHWFFLLWATLGFISTLYLIYLQAFVIGAWCQYCLLSAVTSTLIFVIASVLYLNHKKNTPPKEANG